MKYFAILTGLIVLFYIMGFLKKTKQPDFMNRDFTTAIKGFAILTVVWAHAGARLNVGGIQFIAGVGVALFLICSGYGLEMSYQKNGLKDFWKKRFLKVCVPFWIVDLIGLLIIVSFTIEKYLKDFFFISSGWFMQYIVICYVLFFLVKTVAAAQSLKTQMLIITGVFTLWFVIDSLFFADPGMPFLKARQMFSFPLGMMIAEHKDVIEDKLKNRASLMIIGGFTTGLLFMYITQLGAVKNLPYIASNLLCLLTVIPLSIAVLSGCCRWLVLLKSSALKWTGIISYEIYLIHTFTLTLIEKNVFSIIVFLIATMALAACTKWIVEKVMKRWLI